MYPISQSCYFKSVCTFSIDVRAFVIACHLRVRRLRLLQIDSNEKQELLYIGTAAPALWFNSLFLNHIGDSACRKVVTKRNITSPRK
mgnify:CR=1